MCIFRLHVLSLHKVTENVEVLRLRGNMTLLRVRLDCVDAVMLVVTVRRSEEIVLVRAQF